MAVNAAVIYLFFLVFSKPARVELSLLRIWTDMKTVWGSSIPSPWLPIARHFIRRTRCDTVRPETGAFWTSDWLSAGQGTLGRTFSLVMYGEYEKFWIWGAGVVLEVSEPYIFSVVDGHIRPTYQKLVLEVVEYWRESWADVPASSNFPQLCIKMISFLGRFECSKRKKKKNSSEESASVFRLVATLRFCSAQWRKVNRGLKWS